LDFYSGRNWVAEQLEDIARRYLIRNAGIIAEKIREATMSNQIIIPVCEPGGGQQGEVMVQHPSEGHIQLNWHLPMPEPDSVYQASLAGKGKGHQGGETLPAEGIEGQGAKSEHMYGDSRDWEHQI
jgi:hypothetical protein